MRRAADHRLDWVLASGFVAAVLALLVLAAACALGARGPRGPFPGFFVYRSGAVTSLWRAHWPGRLRGLRVRDVITAVDGQPVRGGQAFQRAIAEAGARGQAEVTLEVRSPPSRVWPGPLGPPQKVTVPLGQLHTGDVAYTLYLPFSIGLVFLLLGVVLVALKPTHESAVAAVLCLLTAAFYLTLFDAHTTWRFTRVWLLYPLLGPLSIHLFARFPEKRPRLQRPEVLVPLYALGVAVIVWRQMVIDDPVGSDWASLVSSILLSCEFGLDLLLLVYGMVRGSSRGVRNRAGTMFMGLGITCGASVAWQFASRVGPPHVPMSADLAMVLSALFPAVITYGILKRDLFDIDAVLRASLSWGIATALVLGVYFAAVAVAGNLAARLAGHSTAATVSSTLLAAALFHPLRIIAQRVIDRIWFRDSVFLPELLALLRALPRVDGVPALAEAVLGPLRKLTAARGAALWVRAQGPLPPGDQAGFLLVGTDGEVGPASDLARLLPAGGALERLPAAPIAVDDLPADALRELGPIGPQLDPQKDPGTRPALLVPLQAKGGLHGLVALWSRRRGSYGAGLRHALTTAAPQLALALENAMLVQEGVQRERLAALGQLAAVIVHEVKNPLGIIKVSAGTLKKRAIDDASAELAACVEDEVDRMDATVRRLLDLARPQAPSLRPCDVRDVVRATLDRLRPDLAASGILVEAALEAAPPVSADPEELRRALLNLFLNAREAMPAGGTLSVRLRPGPGGVEIEVEDTGCGMDEATRRQLFRPFFTTRHGGTGLGLAIVKRVVEDHRGAIRVESRPGQGSRFTLHLPV